MFQIGDILNFLANPLVLFLISFPVLLFVGIYVGVWLTHPRKNRVLSIEPESGRAADLVVEEEDTINAYCGSVANNPPQRFIKRHKALNVVRKGPFRLQTYALWLGRFGTAYTQMLNEAQKKVKVSLRDAVENIFGKDMYDRIPNDEKTGYIKDAIEKSEVGVTVELAAFTPLTPEGLKSLSSDDVRRHDVDTLINSVVRGVEKLSKTGGGEFLKIIFIMGTGIGIGIVLSLLFGWGGTTVVQPPVGG